MLESLEIHDFALIDHVTIDFGPGLNVLTGETGAGKSIIIDAIGALLGSRVGATDVRTGAQSARIDGTFVLQTVRPELKNLLLEAGLDLEDGRLILSREIAATGRTTARVQGRTVPVSVLQQIGSLLVDIHGQSEHLSLLRPAVQLEYLDRFGRLDELRYRVGHTYRRLRQVQNELERLQRHERELAQRADLLSFQIREITEAGLQPEEEQQLLQEYTVLRNIERLAELFTRTLEALSDAEDPQQPAATLIAHAVTALEHAADLDSQAQPFSSTAHELLAQLEDLTSAVRRRAQQLERNPARLAQVEERLELIANLKRKYGDSVPDILAYAKKAADELDKIQYGQEHLDELIQQERKLRAELASYAAELSAWRKGAAKDLTLAVLRELSALNMPAAIFDVSVTQEEIPQGLEVETAEGVRSFQFGETGIDQVELLISPNPGEPLKPVTAIASGGEASRLLLALKSALAHADQTPALVFDEIEIGVGGRGGTVLGEKLWRLANHHQVICVTHLAPVACYADHHFHIRKEVQGERTVTTVQRLSGEAQLEELVVMTGTTSAAAYRTMNEVLVRVRRWKRQQIEAVAQR